MPPPVIVSDDAIVGAEPQVPVALLEKRRDGIDRQPTFAVGGLTV
jgi:hypothetical protein